MTAKEYLMQLGKLHIMIEQRKAQLEELRSVHLSSAPTDKEKVQTSLDGSPLEESVVRYIAFEDEVMRLIMKYTEAKDLIITQIHELEDRRYAEILYKKYVELKNLWDIAEEMQYSHDRIRHLHGLALTEFESRHTIAHLDLI